MTKFLPGNTGEIEKLKKNEGNVTREDSQRRLL